MGALTRGSSIFRGGTVIRRCAEPGSAANDDARDDKARGALHVPDGRLPDISVHLDFARIDWGIHIVVVLHTIQPSNSFGLPLLGELCFPQRKISVHGLRSAHHGRHPFRVLWCTLCGGHESVDVGSQFCHTEVEACNLLGNVVFDSIRDPPLGTHFWRLGIRHAVDDHVCSHIDEEGFASLCAEGLLPPHLDNSHSPIDVGSPPPEILSA